MNILIDVVDEDNGNLLKSKSGPIRVTSSELKTQRDALNDMLQASSKLLNMPLVGLNKSMVTEYVDNVQKTVTLMDNILDHVDTV